RTSAEKGKTSSAPRAKSFPMSWTALSTPRRTAGGLTSFRRGGAAGDTPLRQPRTISVSGVRIVPPCRTGETSAGQLLDELAVADDLDLPAAGRGQELRRVDAQQHVQGV